MIARLRRGLSAASAWAALFAVAGIAYAARRRAPAQQIPAEAGTDAAEPAEELSPVAE